MAYYMALLIVGAAGEYYHPKKVREFLKILHQHCSECMIANRANKKTMELSLYYPLFQWLYLNWESS